MHKPNLTFTNLKLGNLERKDASEDFYVGLDSQNCRASSVFLESHIETLDV